MRINVNIDPARLILRMRTLTGGRGLAFATINAINAAALKVQEAAFENVRRRFQVRKPAFFFGTPERPGGTAARISPRASVGRARPFADVVVRGPQGRGGSIRRTLLPEFETGGYKAPIRGTRVAVPITGGAARPTFPSPVPQPFTFAGLGLRKFTKGRAVTRSRRGRRTSVASLFDTSGRINLPGAGDAVQIKGRHGTFVIRPEASLSYPAGGVFRRTGPGRDDIELVYAFRPKVRLDARLGFVPLGVKVANQWLPEMLERETIREIAKADRVAR